MTVDELLVKAAELHASDLHLTVGVPPKVRIFGDLKSIDDSYPILKPDDLREMVYSILPEKLKVTFEEDGEVDFSYSIPRQGRFRVNAYTQRGSYAMTIRLISEEIPKPEELGIPRSVEELIDKKRGLVIVTGPTGSGKSTTLASLIEMIDEKYEYNIITLEDPIEYLHKHKKSIVNQREIGTDSKSYAKALRAALREDPDVILVGEMRDLDTISIAITAAETGHLVFSTLHTIGAACTIDRIIDVFPPYQQNQIRSQLALVLEGVISQQLVPTHDGKGRKAAFEVMLGTPAIRNLIREGKTHMIGGVIQTSKKQGMKTMDDSIYELYINRFIDKDQALGYAQDVSALSSRMFIM
ncbi:MAG: type IV pilus twitching motility protein PilT [Lachnospiraceae bacterium]|nr:type IV pilus twitching motility protein PilT [Lachnospiraceae bacterium]